MSTVKYRFDTERPDSSDERMDEVFAELRKEALAVMIDQENGSSIAAVANFIWNYWQPPSDITPGDKISLQLKMTMQASGPSTLLRFLPESGAFYADCQEAFDAAGKECKCGADHSKPEEDFVGVTPAVVPANN